ncbi:Uncharacterized conserved protein, DUF2147 family [Sphingomonas sp. YR710]|jgi:uncharacterized protein (DUF2147 family)|uniref:DUF2147 domain-containing protein n=1 Tax=Sphingomonas sp. YR710 TaxID=1882773 RepID=UPI000880D308|nr:DUF2147 domain-containing protein [Sphingomonas sp. YR710]SDD78722.1 Uncharacterized conserved protein, DUF2147 family [Sphingomonas sp. YR710]
MARNIMGFGGIALAATLLALALPAYSARPVTGRWLTEDSKAMVQIEPCGKAVCGRIVRVLKPQPGRSKFDINNPDPKKRSNPIEGTYILTDLVDAGTQWKGRIYNPESGKSYNARLTREADGSLKVEGCIAFLCTGPLWQPAI